MTPSEALKVVALLQGAYPSRQLPDSTAEAYVLALGDLPGKAVREAVVRLIQTRKFLPTIAEIREEVVESATELPSAEDAWAEVRRAISRVGYYRRPEFACFEIQQAVEAIGWRTLCDGENESANRARFLEFYRGYRLSRVRAEATGSYVPPARQLPEPREHGGWSAEGDAVLVGDPSRYAHRSLPAAAPESAQNVLPMARRSATPQTIAQVIAETLDKEAK